jgi:hypothetical protein
MNPRNAIAVLLSASSASTTLSAPPVFEGFDNGPAGWVWADLNCGGPYLNPVSTGPVDWAATGGVPGGFISAPDPSANCYAFRAPAAFLGDLSAYLGGSLSFSVYSTLDNYDLERSVLLVGANGTTLAGIIPMPALNAWSSRSVTLTPASFRVNNQSGPPASAAQLDAVLADVAALYIPAEFGSIVAETVLLDNVLLRTACVADLAPPFGVLNFFDVAEFLSLFNAGSPPADIAEPFGTLDFFDVAAYIQRYNAGCP